jgi:hypothetical protein
VLYGRYAMTFADSLDKTTASPPENYVFRPPREFRVSVYASALRCDAMRCKLVVSTCSLEKLIASDNK